MFNNKITLCRLLRQPLVRFYFFFVYLSLAIPTYYTEVENVGKFFAGNNFFLL